MKSFFMTSVITTSILGMMAVKTPRGSEIHGMLFLGLDASLGSKQHFHIWICCRVRSSNLSTSGSAAGEDPSNISTTGICCRRRSKQHFPSWDLLQRIQATFPQLGSAGEGKSSLWFLQTNRAHPAREGQEEKKSLSDAFALWIMNSSRRSTHYNCNRLIINYAQSMSKRTSSECLMRGNSDWTLSWHFVISTCQQGAQAERQKHSGRKAELEEEGGL